MPRHLSSIRREHIEAWLGALRDAGKSSATVSVYYRSVKSFWRWAVDEGFVKESPMARMAPPLVPEKSPAILKEDQLKALLKACSGTRFEDVRDTAIVRLFLSTPARRAELAGLRLEDVTINARDGYGTMTVLGKGNRWRTMPFPAKAAQALTRYLRERRKHTLADSTDRLWLGYRGPLTGDGVMQMLHRRAQAGASASCIRTCSATCSRTAGSHRRAMRPICNGWQAGAPRPCCAATRHRPPTSAPCSPPSIWPSETSCDPAGRESHAGRRRLND